MTKAPIGESTGAGFPSFTSGRGGITLCAYERGWDIHPKTAGAQKLYEALVKEYN